MSNYSEIKDRLHTKIEQEALDVGVLKLLLPNGRPHGRETELFDYKVRVPTEIEGSERGGKPFKVEIDKLAKQCIAFHNTYGGFIVYGVSETKSRPDNVVGEEEILDEELLRNKIQAATRKVVSIQFDQFSIPIAGVDYTVGVLLIPKRPEGTIPIACVKKGAGKTYESGAIYFRYGDKCIPATSDPEHWKFINGDRFPQTRIVSSREVTPVLNNLPAKDPDLIDFVGREEDLEKLRKWFNSPRDTTRLLSGIGGLGKTTIAYRFAEEVTDTGTGAIDRVVWVSAKARTFSALKGKIVPLSNVHFDDVPSLFRALIKIIAGPTWIPEGTEDEELDNLLEEALNFSPSFLVVDDLDSLDPQAQRDAANRLGEVATLTVGNNHRPSHVLMTSRLEQGLASTRIIKVSGLDKDAFKSYISNLCRHFDLECPKDRVINKLFKTTNGSPLFASSLVRLVKVGEEWTQICETWKDRESEEVRRFAFERELDRLESGPKLCFFAILELGNASVQELSDILETLVPRIREYIAELQGFHLLQRQTTKISEVRYAAAPDLINVKDVLRGQVGARASKIVADCKRLNGSAQGNTQKISIALRDIVDMWKQDRNEDALKLATHSLDNFPNQPDLLLATGKAYLKLSPPQHNKANEFLQQALERGCERPELLPNLTQAQIALEDWQGVKLVSEEAVFRGNAPETIVFHYLKAAEQLSKIATEQNRYKDARAIALNGIKAAHKLRNNSHIKQFGEMMSLQDKLATLFGIASFRLVSRNADKLDLFRDLYQLLWLNALWPEAASVMAQAISDWWRDVLKRPKIDDAVLDIAFEQTGRLDDAINALSLKNSGFAKPIRDLQKIHDQIRNQILEFETGEKSRTLSSWTPVK